MNIKPASQRKRAFTIVEVLMSMCIIAIATAGLMSSFRFALFSIQLARENQRATQIMLERAEAIRCFSWDRLGDVPTAPVTDYYNPATQTPPYYTVTTSLSAFNPSDGVPSYAGNMKKLTIIVSWKTGNVTRSRTNFTYISKDGIQNYVF